ncbi:thioredoxin-dependent thiol peroxidase [Kurthia sibirica]|uniref:thioredoxin-dependent peroxiredoxin n=1 Tax=Kurthia sibirica TaxID=202750 RepID=A0A2U3AL91_9BACL|nr:thioredoxin-dependent thiol peroxidase [Kurthia sibirica]PWI25306.1 thioredoxin-dependent thiol peroxidase [Kurthia sibirica]GEK34630.1 putative peroxiredoxin YgaF [Kurthia sibirica]
MTNLTGLQAPDFSLQNEKGETVSLSDFLNKKNVILYFYPKDMTPGCKTEACDFAAAYEDFSDLDAVILGVSPDSAERHSKFIDKHGLPFSLLVDEDQEVAEKYGVWQLKKNFGKEYMGIVRSTFLVNKEGIVQQEWRNVRVKDHVAAVAEVLRKAGDN